MERKFLICLCSWLFSIILISSTQAMQFAVISDVRVAALDKALEFIKSQRIGLILLPGDFCYDGQDYYPHFEKVGFQTQAEKSPDM